MKTKLKEGGFSNMIKIIAFANQKGGVAKTTSAIALAQTLAMEGKRILFLDLDPQENASNTLRVNHMPTLYDLMKARKPDDETLKKSFCQLEDNISMKNKDTWNLAHKYIGRLWFYPGVSIVPITVISMLFIIGGNEDAIGMVGRIICIATLVILITFIIPMESALKKTFDKDRNSKADVQ